MIKFFRKIRQKSIKENKFTNYLKYAIGEIILVVIGILIALSINNWNTNRVERNQELQYLKSLKADFGETESNLKITLQKQSSVVNYCNQLVKQMRQKNVNIPFDTLGEYIYRGAFSYWRAEPVNGTYDALIGSGKISIIKNENLLQLLAKFAAEIRFGFEDEQMAVDLTTTLVDKSSHYSPNFFPKSLNEYLEWEITSLGEKEELNLIQIHMNNDSFLGTLIMKYGLEKNRLDYQNAMMELVNNVLSELDKELAEEM